MATSGSDNFNQTATEIIQDALALLNVYGSGRTVADDDMSFCLRSLNRMVKSWQAKGLHLWTKEEGVLFAEHNQSTYTLGNGSSDARACLWSDAVITELASAASSTDTSLTVDSTTDMAANDIIGVEQDDDTTHWTTVSSVDSSTTLTLASGLTDDAKKNRNVYTFTSRLTKPLRIHGLRRVTGVETTSTDSESTEIPMIQLSRQEYMDLPTKGSNGLTSHWFYNPDLTTGTLYLWPRPEDTGMYFRFTYERQIEDFDSLTNNPDLPTEWMDTLVYQLAVRVAPAFGKEDKASKLLLPIAADLLNQLIDWDNEVYSIFFMKDHD